LRFASDSYVYSYLRGLFLNCQILNTENTPPTGEAGKTQKHKDAEGGK